MTSNSVNRVTCDTVPERVSWTQMLSFSSSSRSLTKKTSSPTHMGKLSVVDCAVTCWEVWLARS